MARSTGSLCGACLSYGAFHVRVPLCHPPFVPLGEGGFLASLGRAFFCVNALVRAFWVRVFASFELARAPCVGLFVTRLLFAVLSDALFRRATPARAIAPGVLPLST